MDRSFQYGLRHLFVAIAIIAAITAVATDMVQRIASQQGNTVVFALEGNFLAATLIILVELAWLRRND